MYNKFTSEALHNLNLFSVFANLITTSDNFSLSCSKYIGSQSLENSSCEFNNLSFTTFNRGITSVKVSYLSNFIVICFYKKIVKFMYLYINHILTRTYIALTGRSGIFF